MTTCLIRTYFQVVTPESAEQGDCERQGAIDDEGERYTFREAVKLLRGLEPSSSSFHEGVWYTDYEYNHGTRAYFERGEDESRSYHIEGSLRFQRRLYAVVTRKGT